MKKYTLIICFQLIGVACFSQSSKSNIVYNNFTFYYLDNSAGAENETMSDKLNQELDINLGKLKGRTENYFFLYASNGNNYKTEYNLNNILDKKSKLLQTYLSRPSLNPDYDFDKKIIRDNLQENPLFIKQRIEINLYLSADAVRQMINNIEALPLPLTLTKEMLLYIDRNDANIKINVYTDKADYKVDLKDFFRFCNNELGITFSTDVYLL